MPKWIKYIGAVTTLGLVATLLTGFTAVSFSPVFFATLGSQGVAVADSVKQSMAPLSLFLVILYALHAATLFGLHKVFGRHSKAMSPQRLLVASSASIGGPATAVALAQAQKWKSLEMPGLLVGNLGDAIGTFLGIGVFNGPLLG